MCSKGVIASGQLLKQLIEHFFMEVLGLPSVRHNLTYFIFVAITPDESIHNYSEQFVFFVKNVSHSFKFGVK